MGQNFSSEPVVDKETERDHNDIFNVAVSSCQGWRMSQEDNHNLMLDLPGEHKAAFFAVYDGHGSDKVSKLASESLWRHLVENELYWEGNFKEALEKAFLTFDREVNESYTAQLAGTTAVSLLIVNDSIYCANIGDSRGVASVNCECVPLSYDHKPENPQELKRILAAGGYVLGNRVNGNLALSRAFGDFHYKGNDQLPPEQQIVSPCPDVKTLKLNDDLDFLVLACDGIWDVLSSEEVVEFVISRLEENMEPGQICEQLTTRCLATDYELVIGCDNMTVLLVCYTRGRTWDQYCTDIFEKNTRKLGVSRTRHLGEEKSSEQLIDPTRNSGSQEEEVSGSNADASSTYPEATDPLLIESTTECINMRIAAGRSLMSPSDSAQLNTTGQVEAEQKNIISSGEGKPSQQATESEPNVAAESTPERQLEPPSESKLESKIESKLETNTEQQVTNTEGEKPESA